MKLAALILVTALLASCDESVTIGSGPDSSGPDTTEQGGGGVEPSAPVLETVSDAVETDEEAANFLIQATYGPTLESIAELRNLGYSDWFRQQLTVSPDYFLDDTIDRVVSDGISSNLDFQLHTLDSFFEKGQTGSDQLRQRAHFALSQIFVTSTDVIERKSYMHAAYKDLMVEHAFGNFRALLQDVTYNPMMGTWLTYVGNMKADPVIGSAPDENYAREVMQLFTIGLEELNLDGTPKLINGLPAESYTLNDVVELAKVFTGLHYDGITFGNRASYHNALDSDVNPMVMHNEHHSTGVKSFLGETVPDYGDGDQSISHGLDILFNHANVAPFISKQLIQRMTTSNPSPAYVERVATVFNAGLFTLPDGSTVGSGERGDLAPVWAAILLDPVARSDDRFSDTTWGKVREPIVRKLHWMRAAEASGYRQENFISVAALGQVPYRSPSVFNFFRPGYVAPSTLTGDLGLVAPELQITTGPQILENYERLRKLAYGNRGDDQFEPSYARDVLLAESAEDFVDYLDLIYTANQLHDSTRGLILDAINDIDLPDDPADREDALRERAERAHLLLITSIEFMTQR